MSRKRYKTDIRVSVEDKWEVICCQSNVDIADHLERHAQLLDVFRCSLMQASVDENRQFVNNPL